MTDYYVVTGIAACELALMVGVVGLGSDWNIGWDFVWLATDCAMRVMTEECLGRRL